MSCNRDIYDEDFASVQRVIVAVALALLATTGSAYGQQSAEGAWLSANHKAAEAYTRGDFANGVARAEEALTIARGTFDADPRTVTSLNNLALLYQVQGRYGEAEPLLSEALQLSRKVLGPRNVSMTLRQPTSGF